MPQLNSVVLKDGAATPTNHTFVPRDIVAGVATLVESTGIPVGDSTVSIALTKTSAGRRKATLKIVRPVVQNQSINGVNRPTVVRTAYADLTFSFDGTSDTAERRDMLALLASLAGDGMIKSVIGDLQALY